MDARRLIQEIPTATLIEMVGLLTNGKADPQFVRAIVMDIKLRVERNIECVNIARPER
jgi:hypothetical protein